MRLIGLSLPSDQRRGSRRRRHGMGERETPEPFIAACDRFIFVEVLKPPAEEAPTPQVEGLPDLRGLLTHAVQETQREGGWSSLAAVGSYISKNNTSFDPRNYGFKKMGELVRKQPYLEVRETPDTSGLTLQVRLRAAH